MNTREKVVETAKEYLGTPWRHNQRTKGFGIDCVNLLGACADNVGFKIDFPKVYNPTPRYSSLHKTIERYFSITDSTEPGNILLFSVNGDNNHVGIIVKYPIFIHARFKVNNKGKVQTDSLESNYWKKRWVKTYDLLSYKERSNLWSGE